MNRDKIMKRIRTDVFLANNGSVPTCINLLNRGNFSPLKQVRIGVKSWGVGKPGSMDSIHFLKLAGYIEIRTTEGHTSGVDLTNCDYDELEARASERGIRLMQGGLTDECVKV